MDLELPQSFGKAAASTEELQAQRFAKSRRVEVRTRTLTAPGLAQLARRLQRRHG